MVLQFQDVGLRFHGHPSCCKKTFDQSASMPTLYPCLFTCDMSSASLQVQSRPESSVETINFCGPDSLCSFARPGRVVALFTFGCTNLH